MKLGNRLAIIGAALLVVLFLVYIGFQVANNLSEQTVTIDAVEVTVEDKVSAEGAFLRDQVNIPGGDGQSAEYLVGDGEKVAAGQPLAIYFDSESALLEYRRCQALRDKLSALDYARESIAGGADSLKMDELIWRQVAAINRDLSGGKPDQTAEQYARLRQLIISRSATKEDAAKLNEAIEELKREIAQGEKALGGGSRVVYSPASGYFMNFCDGYETVLTAAERDKLSPDQILNAKAAPDTNALGSVTNAFEWYYAAVVSEKEAQQIRERKSSAVYFPELAVTPLEMELVSIRNSGEGRFVVLLRSGVIDGTYLSARRQPIDFVIGSYTGIKVPTEALRQENGEWGVYVLDGSVAKFKPISWVYHTKSYFIVPCAESAKDGLYRFDKIILKAKGLADDKVLK